MPELNDFKDTIKVLGNDEDSLLQGYLNVAEANVQNAVGSNVPSFFERDEIRDTYNICVYSLAGAFYTYRIALSDTPTYDVSLTYKSLIGFMRSKYDVLESEQNEDDDNG
ncbi:DNA packaging, phage associated protein [Fructilactobacillus fructivorans]|uniref:head-tail connector protein n=1 Tax=Fructilactobacillus fructivorans TaxID=1614 RepID=UPI000704FD9C|nr:head-tail connector protein [Fructilactobacillus fructivorans]KRN13343.1 DNA packaging, phage associated protein [Fructilactobacillus fructivorans]